MPFWPWVEDVKHEGAVDPCLPENVDLGRLVEVIEGPSGRRLVEPDRESAQDVQGSRWVADPHLSPPCSKSEEGSLPNA